MGTRKKQITVYAYAENGVTQLVTTSLPSACAAAGVSYWNTYRVIRERGVYVRNGKSVSRHTLERIRGRGKGGFLF